MARIKLTKTIIDRMQPLERDTFLWDSSVPGFGLRVKAAPKGGAKSFVVQYRIGRRTRRLTLGRHGRMTVEQARKHAQRAFGQIAEGVDPLERKQAERVGETVLDLGKRYLEQHAGPKKKASSARMDEINLKTHVYPRLGAKRIGDVTRQDIARLHHDMRATPGAANRVLALVSKMFNLAEAWGLRPDGSNPCRHVERYPERKRERFLSEAELERLGTALARLEHDGTERTEITAAIRLLVLTGCRLGEILGLRWSEVDLQRRCLRLPDSKSGAKTVQLNVPALEVLNGLKDEGEWVIPGHVHGKPLVNPYKPWSRICKAAKLKGVRIHDLRHSFASVGAGAGMSLHVIGKLLGHAQASTTARYAHLSSDPLQQASEQIGSRIAAAMGGKRGRVVELRP